MTTKEYTSTDFALLLNEWGYGEPAREKIQAWLERGDTVLIYRNQDMDSIMLGHPVFLSYGSEEAQVSRSKFPTPPPHCPIELPNGLLAWRYYLEGVYPHV